MSDDNSHWQLVVRGTRYAIEFLYNFWSSLLSWWSHQK